MKKQIYGMAMILLLLTACGKNDIIGSETISAETVQESETALETEVFEEVAEEDETGKENANHSLNIELSAQYEGEWDESGAIITADCSEIHILDEGYAALKTVLQEYNEKNWQEVYDIYLENRENVKDSAFTSAEKLSISREITITRADERILSFINMETSYLGGAHGDYYADAEVFDTETGEALKISDVVTDLDAVYAYVLEELKAQENAEMYFDGYEETLHQVFYEESETLEWNMDMEGITFTFNPYLIAPWAARTISVNLPFELELIKEEYSVTTERPILRVNVNVPFVTDADGDGSEERYVIYERRHDETYTTELTLETYPDVELPEEELEVQKKSQEFKFYGELKYLYVVTAKNGKKYLYTEFLSENDWHSMEVIDLSALLEERDAYVGKADGATYGHFIADSDQFSLYKRIYVLGTYTAYKIYCVGEDGMPITDSDMYELVNCIAGREIGLTTKKNLKVQLYLDGSDETEEMVLQKGTVVYPKGTDESTVMKVETEDGRICDLFLEKSEMGTFQIDGVDENDCFEFLPYAG